MNKPLLSILIPTVVGREKEVERLIWTNIKSQIDFAIGLIGGYAYDPGFVEVFWYTDNKEMTIGEKRERLYGMANGVYSLQVDDDDAIYGINSIIEKIAPMVICADYVNALPSCITYRENCMINGKYYSSNHSLKYDDWGEKQDGFDYVRTPFYKDVIRTDIARSIPFERIRYGEDHAWSRALKPHLKTEIHITEEIYFYIHNSKPEDHNERYGIR